VHILLARWRRTPPSQAGESSRRYEGLARACKQINPPADLRLASAALVSSASAASGGANVESFAVSRHVFSPPAGATPQKMQQARMR